MNGAGLYDKCFRGKGQGEMSWRSNSLDHYTMRGTFVFNEGETDMGDKGSKDKGKREQQKKAQRSPKEKRKLKKEKKDTRDP